MKRAGPHLEDGGGLTGGDTTEPQQAMATPLPGTVASFTRAGFPPPGENRDMPPVPQSLPKPEADDRALMDAATAAGTPSERKPGGYDFLHAVGVAEQQAMRYMQQTNRRAWTTAYHAFHNEHFPGSKFNSTDWRARSHFFKPKTRSAVRKDMAAVAASLFGTMDAINCSPGDEGDARQRGAAAVMQELVNYRTDRTSGRAALPWFPVCMGARQDSLIAGICLSKQSWLLDLRQEGSTVEDDDEGGRVEREVWVVDTNRPDIRNIPPENFLIDPAADWTNPCQSATYILVKYPMSLEEIHRKQRSPHNPWHKLSDEILRTAVDAGKVNTSGVRRARDQGLDRIDETQTGTDFQIVWVYETFIKHGGTDWTFFSLSDQYYLTDPRPVREVYPEQAGDRPLSLGYGFLEAHRIFPMSPVESWQPHQQELNELGNLALDAIKENVMPVTKIVKGRQIDIDQVKRRSSGSSIIVTKPEDVTFDRPPDIPQSVPAMVRDLSLDFDDLAGQFNGATAQDNNALSRTLGGLKLVAGASNAVQEFDIRIWLETWAEPALAQLVRLEQYYEDDETILGICGARAGLVQKFGVSTIDDDLLEQEVTIRVSAGLGAGDPQQRLAKFQAALGILEPILTQSPAFQRGEIELDDEEVIKEVMGAAGYSDGGMRFFKRGQPQQPNPINDLKTELIQSQIEKNKSQGKSSLMMGMAALRRAALGDAQLEADNANALMDFRLRAVDVGARHGGQHVERMLSARDMGHRHGHDISQHRHTVRKDMATLAQQAQPDQGEQGDQGGAPAASPPNDDAAQVVAALQNRRPVRYNVVRDARGQAVSLVPVYADEQPPAPPAPGTEVPLPTRAA